MNPGDPNVLRVEVVAEALGDLCDELFLVGGCAASLLIDAPSASPARVTYDVDVIAEVAAADAELRAYLAMRFDELGRHPDFENTLPGLVAYDELFQSRIAAVRHRISAIAGLEPK